jgi:hypothetical protein
LIQPLCFCVLRILFSKFAFPTIEVLIFVVVKKQVIGATYEVGETILAHSFSNHYEAVVLNVRKDAGVCSYFLHYQGWNKKWYETPPYL